METLGTVKKNLDRKKRYKDKINKKQNSFNANRVYEPAPAKHPGFAWRLRLRNPDGECTNIILCLEIGEAVHLLRISFILYTFISISLVFSIRTRYTLKTFIMEMTTFIMSAGYLLPNLGTIYS